ncbi:MAG: ABC transporter ATP-binding protein [Terriglobales bacterium]
MATIALDGLEVRFGNRIVLNGLSGSLNGRAIGLLGPNGSGKTTLINTLLGFHAPSGGTARVLDLDILQYTPKIRGAVGYMPESDSFIAGMSGLRFVRYMAELAGVPPQQAMERAHETMLYVGLGEVRYRKLGTYSQGMKQLVKLAQALAHGPKLLILDEPTNGLDPLARQRMIQLIREVRDTGDIRLLLSSHLLRDVDETCDEVLILKEGQVAAICNLEAERRTNRKFIEMETVGATDSYTEAIRRMGCECASFSQGRLKLVMPEGVEIRDLYTIATQQGVQIRRMHHRRDSLEDIFLNAMEGRSEAARVGL